MKPEEIKLGDWVRAIFGSVPPEFYLEIIIRAGLVYLLLMVSLRLLGKRMATKMSRIEMAAMSALASAIGVPILDPGRGILPAFIMAFVIIIITRVIASKSFKNQHFEQLSQDDVDLLVEEAVMNFDIMKRVRISRERLFAQLRSENVNHLGSIKRVYMEANGAFTVVKNDEPEPGLMILPEWDKDFISRKLKKTDLIVCKTCGIKKPEKLASAKGTCENCGENRWTKAVIDQ